MRFEIPEYDYASAALLERELGVSHAVAQVLVRRGHDTPEAARAWLAAEDEHSPDAFAGMDEAVALILDHVARASRITVHGDYDVDGVCSTAIMVRALRRRGAVVDWYLPSRTEDGYGLSLATVERLAARGTGLLVTVDCAITACAEVDAARAAGVDVLVTDHHQPRADGVLPAAPIVHPLLGGYPCPDLCAAGVAYKLALALDGAAGEDPRAADEDLDLVALATVADVVPLRGENRRLVRAGLRAMAATAKPGLRALMRVAELDPGLLDAHALAFRLAPRINAAGRLYRADAGLELVLTTDEDRAAEVAQELDRANGERRHVETRILFEAEAQVAAAGERAAYVLAGEDWHPGVIGIVASRVAERHHRPVVLIALDGDRGTGSGRSIPAFDLLAGLNACAEHLARHGGHRAAAGLEIERDRVEAFRAAFEAHAAAVLAPEDLVAVERVDAVVSGDALGLGLAEELAALAPFGAGNPAPRLLVPAATLTDPRTVGEGKHVAFTLSAGGARCRAVAFGSPRLPVAADEPADATFSLQVGRFNGAVEPKLVLRQARACEPGRVDVVGEPEAYLPAAFAELDAALEPWPPPVPERPDGAQRAVVDRRGSGAAGVLADLVATGAPVLAVCADVMRRLEPLRARLGGLALCSYAGLERDPALANAFPHVVALDPPVHAHLDALLRAGRADEWTHMGWGANELRFSQQVHEQEYGLRASLAALYRVLRDRGGADGEELEAVLRGDGPHHRSAQLAGRLLRILSELRLVSLDRDLPALTVPVAQRTALERSAAFRAYEQRHEDGLRYLQSATARAA